MLAADQQRPHSGIIDGEFDFRARQTEVQRHTDRTKPGRREKPDKEHRVIETQIADPIADADTGRGKCRRELFYPSLEVTIGPGDVITGQCRTIGASHRTPPQPFCQSDHGVFPSLIRVEVTRAACSDLLG